MANTIGEVNINLRMSLVEFKKDTKDGAAAMDQAAKKISNSAHEGFGNVRSQLGLLDNAIRGSHAQAMADLVRMFSQSSVVMSALPIGAAVGGFLLLGGVVAELVGKIGEMRKQAEELRNALKDAGEAGRVSMRKLDEEILKLEAQLAELNGQHLKALQLRLQDIDLASLDNLRAQFDGLKKQVDETLGKMAAAGFWNTIGLGNSGPIKDVRDHLDEVIRKVQTLGVEGKKADIGKLLDTEIAGLQKTMAAAFGTGPISSLDEDLKQAYQYALNELNTEKQLYDLEQTRASKAKELAQKSYDNSVSKQATEDAQATTKLRSEVLALYSTMSRKVDSPFEAIQRQEEELEGKLRQLAADNPVLFAKVFNREPVELVIASMRRFSEAAQDTAMHKGLQDIQRELAALDKEVLPNLGAVKAQLPSLAPDAHVPTSAQATLEKIKADRKAAAEEARKVVDGIETQNQKLEDQQAILEELRRQGLLTGEEYDKAMKKAQDAADGTSKAWGKFGTAVGEDITQATLFGRSWSDAIKTIIVQMVALVAQMTILKSVKESMDASGGGGGFLSGLVGGIFGGFRAGGGPVDPGHAYIVGEQGPEFFMPTTSGSIVPSGAGGLTVAPVYNIDARGADAGVEQRIRAALKESEDRAVTRAIVTQCELQKRR